MIPLADAVHAGLHAAIDVTLASAIRWPRLYPAGFGDIRRLQSLVEAVQAFDPEEPAADVTIRWIGARPRGRGMVRTGSFRSPASHLLPEASADVPVELVLPHGAQLGSRRVCVLFAASGEEGFRLRRAWARRLAEHGIGTLLFENPYYGTRRPPGQHLAAVRTVADQFAMNLATVEEGRALVRWLRGNGFERIGVSGYSQGGMMAAFVGALTPFPVATIPRGAGAAARPVFTEKALSTRFAWCRLAEDLRTREAAERFFARCLDPVDVCRFPPPVARDAAILLASSHDAFVPPAEVRRLHRHWTGSELRWLTAGHASGLLYRRAHLRAVRDGFDRLDAGWKIEPLA